ncbi:alpha/beta fold hydrolase [Cellulomonas iranensis]|uniref:alpha/beta fold hydrolase n=1 Tax=Cellulomonas iranensis TaxID=76862 RepID=UPI0013D888A3|nr:alpha/beta fold hydrolase [Cellulomonas iranensis]
MTESIYRTLHDPHARRRIDDWCDARLSAWDVPHRSEHRDTVAGPTHVLTAGDPDVPVPVVLVPGANACAAAHLPALTALATRGHVVAPDVPGEPGLSSGRRVEGARVHQLGAWLDEVVTRLDRPVVLVGHALGAAAALATTSPLVVGRVLVCPGGLRRPRLPPRVLAAAARWRAAPRPATSYRLLEHLVAPAERVDPELVEWLTLVGRHVRPGFVPGRQADRITDALRSRPPVVAAGVHDRLLPPAHVAPAARRLLGTDVVPLACGHLPDAAAWGHVAATVDALVARRA